MKVLETTLPGVKIIEPRVFGDARGFFFETWSAKAFGNAGLSLNFVQDNHSRSNRGVLRGMHYQIEHAQGKLVRVSNGSVFDAVVDLRRSSPTFGKWEGFEISAENKRLLWVPPGFAHGFLCLEDNTDFMYKCTDIYAPEYERSLLWSDPTVAIAWPIEGIEPVIAAKDAQGVLFADADSYI